MKKFLPHTPSRTFQFQRRASSNGLALNRLILSILLVALGVAGLAYAAREPAGRELALRDFKGEVKGPKMKFSKQEMNAITGQLKGSPKLSKENVVMEILPGPDGGGWGIPRHRCPKGCELLGVGGVWGPVFRKYSARFGWPEKPGADGEHGYTPGPDQEVVIISCDCPIPEPATPAPPFQRPVCVLVFAPTSPSSVQLGCVNRHCRTRCVLAASPQPNGTWLVGCQCR